MSENHTPTLLPCMADQCGRTITKWMPEMQSSAFLRLAIGRGERTSECWAELCARNDRVRAGIGALSHARA